jgi:hypothetical protein
MNSLFFQILKLSEVLLQQNIITQLPSLYTLHITDEFKDFYHEVFETYIQSGQNSIFNYEQ